MGQLFNLDSPLMQGLSKAADLIILNLLAVFCSIPIVTIGASAAALYYAVGIMQDDRGHLVRSFFQAFKSNFKQATALWLIMLAVGLLLAFSLWFYLQVDLTFGAVLAVIFIVLLVLWCMAISWVFPLQAKFVNTVRSTLRNAVLCALGYLPRSILMAVLNVIPLAVLLLAPYLFLRIAILWLFIWYALTAFMILRLLKKPYSAMIHPSEEQDALETLAEETKPEDS